MKIAGIVLAAGTSSRMGQVKQLLAFNGQPLLQTVMENARGASLQQIVVVLGDAAEVIQQKMCFANVDIAVNDAYAEGRSTSIQAGLRAIDSQCDGALFILADQPLVTAQIMDTIIHAYRQRRTLLTLPRYDGRRGNPVLVDKMLFPGLNALRGDNGAGSLFEEFPDQICEVEVSDNAVHRDIDTWDDYLQLVELECSVES